MDVFVYVTEWYLLEFGSSLLESSSPFLCSFFKLDYLYELKQQLYWFSMPMWVWLINKVNGSTKLKFYFETLLEFYYVNNLVNSEQVVLPQVIKNFKFTNTTRVQNSQPFLSLNTNLTNFIFTHTMSSTPDFVFFE